MLQLVERDTDTLVLKLHVALNQEHPRRLVCLADTLDHCWPERKVLKFEPDQRSLFNGIRQLGRSHFGGLASFLNPGPPPLEPGVSHL